MKKTKKPVAVLLSLVLLCAVIPLGTFTVGAAAIGPCGDNLIWAYNSGTYTLTVSGTGEMTNYNSISPAPWDAYRDSIQTVRIGSGVLSVGSFAFSGYTDLASVTLSDSVTSIGTCAFSGCTGLTSIALPDSVTTIGSSAFYDCTGLTSVTIPKGVISVGSDAFYNTIWYNNQPNGPVYVGRVAYKYKGTCSGRVEILPGTVSIADSAFKGCTGLTSITLPDSLTTIGSSAFYNCIGLTEISIPDGVTSIGLYAFFGCAGLSSVTVPDSITAVEGEAFYGCTSLTRVNITDLAAWCGIPFSSYYSNPLYYAHNLYLNGEPVTELVIPEEVTAINDYVFSGFSGLTAITIPDSVTTIGSSAFRGCTGLTAIVIPDSVTTVGNAAFRDCTGLTSVTMPIGVIPGSDCFYNCGKYTVTYTGTVGGTCGENCIWELNAETGVLTISGTGAMTINTYEDNAPWYDYRGSVKTVNIESGVTTIADSAFEDCADLTVVTIPDSVTAIGNSAFRGCTGLTTANIGNGVTTIGHDAFSYCTGLTAITIPAGVITIGSYAFRNCTSLTRVNITDLAAWCGISFGSYDSNPLYYAHNLYLNGEPVTDLVIPEGVTKINAFAFCHCTGLTSVTLPDSVTEIGSSVFSGCTGLSAVNIGSGLTTIGYDAFEYCTGLTEIIIPTGVTFIGNGAFSGCPITIYGEADSEAQWYAAANEIKFVPKPAKIKVFSLPDKTVYRVGEEYDPEGLIVAVYLPNLRLEWWYGDFCKAEYDFSTPGTKTVTLTYLGASATFTVEVKEEGSITPEITSDDMVRLYKMLLGKTAVNTTDDYNKDGIVDIRDLVELKKKLACAG